VRGFSFFGVSFVYIIFEDGTDIYWARSRVLEYLKLGRPEAAGRRQADSGTGRDRPVGWVLSIRRAGRQSLTWPNCVRCRTGTSASRWPRPRAWPRWRASAAFVRQYNVVVRSGASCGSFGVPLGRVIEAIRASNREVGGRVVEMAETEFMVRGRGYIKSVADLEQIVLKPMGPSRGCCETIARVDLGPDERRASPSSTAKATW